jgi:hypothetical protein
MQRTLADLYERSWDVLRGPRGDSSTTISYGKAFSSHPRPPLLGGVQVIHQDDKEKDREVFSEVRHLAYTR